jgi:hypothetical protein
MLIAELKLKSPAAKSNMASTNSKLYGLCFSRKIISIINWGMSPKITANEKHFRRWGTRVPSADSL